ncbi:hypothetical protein PASE110613_01385 [Paenibacillus sediminis]|uniref:Transcriptional regulator of viral defense system n=1 Tax=Paenibacillus sediminis TaxID=664909 RepID=A0ABS4GZR4_9BACL|nr:hypothetical protein [Paenibacillus sediminis]MBP1935764.1 putative transcriptional regulator of viral defense system [Paenibacillus sediminis]
MDKRKVIAAYRRGFITIQECAQILGVESAQLSKLMDQPEKKERPFPFRNQSVNE